MAITFDLLKPYPAVRICFTIGCGGLNILPSFQLEEGLITYQRVVIDCFDCLCACPQVSLWIGYLVHTMMNVFRSGPGFAISCVG